MFWYTLLVFILFTILFFSVIVYKANLSRCSEPKKKCYDGNGIYQYKGRGYEKEPIEVLLSRIDWLAKNSVNHALYSTSYIIAYAFSLAAIVILFAFTSYIVSPWELVVILFSGFIICFSILNLFQFHTDSYPNYYIRKNIEYISKKFQIPIKEPPCPSKHSKVPFRTQVQDTLSK